ncbi:phage holin family protein [Flavihumibacter sp. CACIAM 22H1]|uniref:phage holin family protein n=1 Tax=Flavihumibacter sp. CACIAM 22H1 TaxID=1812911 RepID=UPI0025C059CA|nr:phage holin family protein [Flavihumibacter sp. CACIAM 22H1]
MDTLKSKAADLLEHGGELLDTYYRLTVVNATDKVAKASSVSVVALAAALFGLIVLFFAGIGMAWWIGEAMNNMKAGFFIVGGFFLLLLLALLLFRKSLLVPMIRNQIIQSIYDKSDKNTP